MRRGPLYDLPASSADFDIVVDPKTTTVLSTSESYAPDIAPVVSCGLLPAGKTARLTPDWTILLQSGVAQSFATPPGDSEPGSR
jgi:hypothetical protein